MQDKTLNLNGSNRGFPKWLTIFRVALGLILFAKGISFFHDSTSLETMMHRKGWDMFDNNAETFSFIITYVNLLGGLFIATGLFTRWVALVQIPILIGAVIFNMGASFSGQELFLSIISLLLSVIFVIKGSGAISADEFFRSYTFAGQEGGHTKRFFQ